MTGRDDDGDDDDRKGIGLLFGSFIYCFVSQ